MSISQVWDTKITGMKGKPWPSSLNINYIGSCKHFGDVNRDALCTGAILATAHWCPRQFMQDLDPAVPLYSFPDISIPSRSKGSKYMDLDGSRFPIIREEGSSHYHLIFQHPLLPEIPALEMSAEVSSHAGSIPAYSAWQFIKQPD
ncbi:hypothetical protein B0H13DRAFT_1882903 [Mycena leptocephala]|nr:hypothetical protein B0H13DRAFT_1882903 [Mycena leptocephala]